MGATIHLRGSQARNFFAEQMLDLYGAEEALTKTCGPMHEAIKREIERRQPTEAKE